MPLTENSTPVVDINIEGIEKTKVRINGDNDSILELNLSDLHIVDRLNDGYEKLQEKVKSVAKLDIDEDNLSEKLNEIDTAMREMVDYIFDSNVSEVCCKSGTMFDMTDGTYKFERIIEALTKLYSDNINAEYKAMKKRVQQKADTYLPADHKKSTRKKK